MRALLLLLLLSSAGTGFAQCQYDFDGNGFADVGDGDVLYQLANFGSDDPDADHNDDGIVDILDVLEYLRHAGMDCPIEQTPLSTGRILGLSLVEYHLHETELADDLHTISAGSVTYRLYLEVADENEYILGIYGDEDTPLTLTSSSPLFNHEAGAFQVEGIMPLFYPVFPTLEFDSWMSNGRAPDEPEPTFNGLSILDSPEDTWMEDFDADGMVSVDSPAGSGLLTVGGSFPTATIPNLRLLGQFTVPSGTTLSGSLNVHTVQLASPFSPTLSYEVAENLTFSTGNLGELGCTDAEAENYAPTATLDDGSCTYFGDLDDDGEVGSADILEIITNFGCTTCGDLDLDGDGVVGIGDLLLLLGLV